MWQISPVAFGPTMRLAETILPVKGAFVLYVFTGIFDWSQNGSASSQSCFFAPGVLLKRPFTALAILETSGLSRTRWQQVS